MTKLRFGDYNKLVSELLDIWIKFVESDTTLRLGKHLPDLMKMMASFCGNSDYSNVQRCCEMEFEILNSEWDQLGMRNTLDLDSARGAIEFYLATAYVGQKNLEAAVFWYKESSQKFIAKVENDAAATIWFCIGKVYVFQRAWPRAIWAFQRSLNYVSPRSNITPKLEEEIDKQFSIAKDGLEKQFKTPPQKPRLEVTAEEENAGVRKVPIVHRIAAGSPTMMGETILKANIDLGNICDNITVDVSHLNGAEMGLLVTGSSMIEGGIWDGDYALIRLMPTANNGEIVAAAIFPDGEGGDMAEATLKKYYKETRPCQHHYLKPMNPDEPQILVVENSSDLDLIKTDYAKRGLKIQSFVGKVNILGKLVAIWRRTEK